MAFISREQITIVACIQHAGQLQLFHVVQTLEGLAISMTGGERRQKQYCQQSQCDNHDQQFNHGEGAATFLIGKVSGRDHSHIFHIPGLI